MPRKKVALKSPKFKKEKLLPNISEVEVPVYKDKILKGSALVSASSDFNKVKKILHREATSYTAQVLTNIPYTPMDYIYFEDAWSWTLAGLAVDKKLDFVIGRGITPTIVLIDQGGMNEEQIQAEAKKYEYIIDRLVEIDELPAVNAKQTFYDVARMAKVFGRSVVGFEYGTQSNAGVPIALKIIHPRDLGRVQVNELDWSIESVINYMGLTVGESNIIKAEDMIYLVNGPNNPMRRNLYYGHSEMQRVIGAARAYRRIIEYDVPEIVEAMWAGYGLFLVDPEGKQPADVQAELTTLLTNLSPGTFGAVSGKPNEKIQFIPLDLKPNIDGIVKLIDTFERLIIGNQTVPAALLGREEDSNYATLIGKIRLFIAGPIAQDREWLGNIIDRQWYNPLLKKLFPEEAKIIKIKTEFEPIITESWVDNIDALQKLSITVPQLPPEKLLELVGMDNYKNDLEPTEGDLQRVYQKYPPSPEQVGSMYDKMNQTTSVPVPPNKQKPGQPLIKQTVPPKQETPETLGTPTGKQPKKVVSGSVDDNKPVSVQDDIIPFWDDPSNNISRKLHTIDPNEHNKKQSLITANKSWKQLDPEEQKLVIIGYSFRHKEKNMGDLFPVDPRTSANNRWSVLTTSMRDHILDPHSILNRKETSTKEYKDLKGQDKKDVDALFDLSKNEESSNLAQGIIFELKKKELLDESLKYIRKASQNLDEK